MADFFFFTDIDLLSAQTTDQAFGPLATSDPAYDTAKEQYRLTSIHEATADCLAYAVCKGQVLVQEDATDSSLVNIILKPEQQTANDLPYIKYYIYRGILKSSVTDGVNVAAGGNTLTTKILAGNPTSPQKVLGIELTGTDYSNSDPIDNAFYLPKTGFELWTVYGGWSIGTFDKHHIGFEIIFERLGYNPDFSIARSGEHVFEMTILTGTPSQADLFDYKTQKEIVANYLDAAAFYGNFYSSSIGARVTTDTIDSNAIPSFSSKSGDTLYRDVIDGGTTGSPTNIFVNRNTVYLDVRNDLNYSFNYFENYNDNLKLSFIDDSNEPSTLVDYYASGWPVLQLTSLPTGNNSTSVRIAFPVNAMNIPLTCTLTGKRKISIIEKVKTGKSSFQLLTSDLSTNYTADSLFIISPNYNNNIACSQYIRVKYIDRLVDNTITPVNDYTPVKGDVLDFIFMPAELNLAIDSTAPININVMDEEMYINLLNDFGIDYTSKIGIAKDANNAILFWAVSKRCTKPRFKTQSPSFSITKSIDATQTFFTKYIDNKAKPDSLSADTILVSGDPIQLIKEVEKLLDFLSKRNSIDFDTDFFSIVLSNADFATIKTIAETNFTDIYKPYLCITNKTNGTDDQGVSFLSFDLTVKGLARNGSNTMEIDEFATGVTIYSYPFADLNN